MITSIPTLFFALVSLNIAYFFNYFAYISASS